MSERLYTADQAAISLLTAAHCADHDPIALLEGCEDPYLNAARASICLALAAHNDQPALKIGVALGCFVDEAVADYQISRARRAPQTKPMIRLMRAALERGQVLDSVRASMAERLGSKLDPKPDPDPDPDPAPAAVGIAPVFAVIEASTVKPHEDDAALVGLQVDDADLIDAYLEDHKPTVCPPGHALGLSGMEMKMGKVAYPHSGRPGWDDKARKRGQARGARGKAAARTGRASTPATGAAHG